MVRNQSDKTEKADTQYPITIAGAFIFNEQDELLLIKGHRWHDKYVCVGGKIELNETIIDALKREAKEEVNLDISEIKPLYIIDGIDLAGSYKAKTKHLIFLDYTARALNPDRIRLNEEASAYKWKKIDDWLKMDKDKFGPYMYDNLIRLKEKTEEISHEGLYKRALADYQNLLKQTAIEKQELARFSNEKLLREILPVYDYLKLALKHSGNTAEKNSVDEGLKYVLKQFKEVLEKFGIQEIKTEGEMFDHNKMEAISKRKTDEQDLDGKVAEELKPGYVLSGKVIEHARVIVWEYDA